MGQKPIVIRKKEPIVRNGYGYHRYLTLNCRFKSSGFEFRHVWRVFSHNATFGENCQIQTFVKRFQRFLYCFIPTADIVPINQDVKLSVHVAKKGNFSHGVLTHKCKWYRCQPHDWDVQEREVVGAEYVNFIGIYRLSEFDINANKA